MEKPYCCKLIWSQKQTHFLKNNSKNTENSVKSIEWCSSHLLTSPVPFEFSLLHLMRKSWEQCTNFSNSVVIISPVLVSLSAMKSGVWNSEANGNISQIFSLFFLIRKGFPLTFHWLFISKNQKLIKFDQNKLLNPLQPSVN